MEAQEEVRSKLNSRNSRRTRVSSITYQTSKATGVNNNEGVSQITKSIAASKRRSSLPMDDGISVTKGRVEKIMGPHSALGSYRVDNQ